MALVLKVEFGYLRSVSLGVSVVIGRAQRVLEGGALQRAIQELDRLHQILRELKNQVSAAERERSKTQEQYLRLQEQLDHKEHRLATGRAAFQQLEKHAQELR
ncbi:MAG: hypothetical protein EZS28_045625, partial [Streblomastix strix]